MNKVVGIGLIALFSGALTDVYGNDIEQNVEQNIDQDGKAESDKGSEQDAFVDDESEQSEKINKVVISAYRDPFLSQAPESVAAVNVDIEEAVIQPESLLSVIEGTAGVASNGQGGLFQTYSIRGVAKHRVKTLIDGIPITSERRAGVSASYVDPLMFGSVDIIRGPVSTFYGSGALGGVVNVHLTNPPGTQSTVGLQSQGNSYYLAHQQKFENSVLGVSYRSFGQTEAANDRQLNDKFDLKNLYLSHDWRAGSTEYNVWWLESHADDIGKSNLRFPDQRITNYPEERHSIVKLSALNDSGWAWSLYLHPNSLVTDNIRPGSRINITENEALEYGGNWQTRFYQSEDAVSAAQWGIDWNSRDKVDAVETQRSFVDNSTSVTSIIENGQLDDLAVFVSAQVAQGDQGLWHLGARYNWQQQSEGAGENFTSDAVSAFVGLDWEFSERFTGFINLATGFRFPTLTERFFSGTTPRGEVIADPNLRTEKSFNTDLGVMWVLDRHKIEVRGFVMEVDNYIERTSLPSGQNIFVNLLQGDIEGGELEYQWSADNYQIDASYTRYLGRDNNGVWLADIPADRFNLGYQWYMGNFGVKVNWLHRRDKAQFGDGEVALDSTDQVSLKVQYEINPEWQLDMYVANALDKLYIPSADDLDTFGSGRNIGLSLKWREQ